MPNSASTLHDAIIALNQLANEQQTSTPSNNNNSTAPVDSASSEISSPAQTITGTPICHPKPPPPTPASSYTSAIVTQHARIFGSEARMSSRRNSIDYDYDDSITSMSMDNSVEADGECAGAAGKEDGMEEEVYELELEAVSPNDASSNILNVKNFSLDHISSTVYSDTIDSQEKNKQAGGGETKAEEVEEESIDMLVRRLKLQINSSDWLEKNPASGNSIFDL